jgi:hypothetical protein
MKVMIDPAFPDHRKLWALAEALKISEPLAAGHVLFLWCRVMLQSPLGDISGWTEADIARAAGWKGNRKFFCSALSKVGFLEKGEIHAWIEHQGNVIEKREQWRDRWKKKRERDSRKSDNEITRESRVNHDVITRASRTTLPSPPLPFPSLPGGGAHPPLEGALGEPFPPSDVKSLIVKAKIPGKPDTVDSYVSAWIARSSVERVMEILSDPWSMGKQVIEIQDHFFPHERNGTPKIPDWKKAFLEGKDLK